MSNTFKVFLIAFTALLSFSAVNSRIQLKPPEEIKVERIPNGPPCTLNINKDLVEPQPLFLQPGSTDSWPVEIKGDLEIPRGADVELHCSQGFYIKNNAKSMNATCLENKTFLVNQEKIQFGVLNCSAPVKYKVRATNITCANDAKLFQVGFNVSVNRFIKTLDICHDSSAVNTVWTFHTLEPANVHFQKSVQRLNFSKAGFFGKRNMNHLYSKENQKHVFQSLLGRNYERFFNNRTQFLSRGHLSSKTDHVFGTHQRATFNFFNAAPQWQIFNGGTWNAVENRVRKFVADRGLEVECFTGSWGVISLPNQNGEPRDIYLSFDENNNGEIPVPKLYFKVLVDTKSRPHRGIALIGVNNPYLTIDELRRDYIICDDISDWVPWIRWKRENLAKGYFYSCKVDEFARAVKFLPKRLEKVSEILV